MTRLLPARSVSSGQVRPAIGRSIAWRLLLLCLLSYASFASGEDSNILSREALVLSMVRTGTLQLGPLADMSVDKAYVKGRYYLDKAPGLSFLALPTGFVLEKVISNGDDRVWLGQRTKYSAAYAIFVLITTILSVGITSSLTIVAFYRYNLSDGASLAGALFAAGILAFATPFWGWSTVFFGHAVAGSLLLIGFMLLSTAMNHRPASAPARRRWSGAAAGFVLGFAFVVEYPSGPAVAIIGLCCFCAAIARPDRVVLCRDLFLPATAGLILAMVPLALYNNAAFGSPLSLGYGAVQGFPGMKTGLFGIALPDLDVAWKLLVGWSRGLLLFSPVLLLVPLSWSIGIRQPGDRLGTVVAMLVFFYYLAMNSGYYYWDGGYSTGPRHLVPALPLATIMLARLWDASTVPYRRAFLVLASLSLAITVIYTCVEVYMPPANVVPNPFTDYLLPRFINGELNRLVLGKIAVLHGFPALVPLLVAWIVIVRSILRLVRSGTVTA
jgi:hypothetical protein